MAKGAFATLLFADYSGARSESAQRRSIALWRQERGGRPFKVEGPFTRESLRKTLLEELSQATRDGRRVLFGIDHQWSWPKDLWAAAGLLGRPWRRALGDLVKGDGVRPPLSGPDTFPAAFNAFAGRHIFHCRLPSLGRRYRLPPRGDWDGDPTRATEHLMPGAKPATRLGGPGAVAGQTLFGLGNLHELLEAASAQKIPLKAWPFDLLADDGRSHIGLEVYPSFCRPRGVPKSDDSDARACCLWASKANLARAMDLSGTPLSLQRAARIEGWILGARPEGARSL